MLASDSIEFGSLLRSRRREAGLTQEMLAERAGISVRGIADLERGRTRAPRRDTMELLASALHLSSDERFQWEAIRRRLSVRRTEVETRRNRDHDLPAPPNRLVGRNDDVDSLVALLSQRHVRLVTVTGPGGVGKTRVALETGIRLTSAFSDGIHFIELAAVRDPGLVLPVIARRLGLQAGDNRVMRNHLRSFVAQRQLLLILDNFEHVSMAALEIAELLRDSATLHLLITSRARLNIQAEHEFTVAPLESPGRDAEPTAIEIARYPAVELFIQRSRQVNPTFTITPANASAVGAICSQLDGLPLAIELAAARIKVLSPQEMLPRLANRLEFLAGGLRDAPDRHQTMRAAVAWNYYLLDANEQRLFRQLSTFVGGWTLEAVEAIAPAEIDAISTLETLVNNSLVSQLTDSSGRTRFGMLETIREFGLECLDDAGELNKALEHHAGYFLRLAEEAEPSCAPGRQSQWVKVLLAELPNFRAALDWSLQPNVDPDVGLRMAGSLAWLWNMCGYVSEGREWLERVLSRLNGSTQARMKALVGAGWMLHVLNESTVARELVAESLLLAEQLDDRWTIAWATQLLGRIAYFDGDVTTARSRAHQSLEIAQELEDPWLIGWAHQLHGLAAHIDDDFEVARRYYRASLDARRPIEDEWGIAVVTGMLGMLSLREGDHRRALEFLQESLALCYKIESPWLMLNMIANIVHIAALRGEHSRAAALGGVVAATSNAVGARPIPIAARELQRGMDLVRSNLRPHEIDRASNHGYAMSSEDAVREAMLVGKDSFRE